MYILSNGTKSVITIRVRYTKKSKEDFAIEPGEILKLTDRQFQLIEGDRTTKDAFTRLNVLHINDELADTNEEIQKLIDQSINNLSRGTPVTLTPDLTNQKGTSSDISSADHVHEIPTDIPVGIEPDAPTQLGSAASFARSDHQHRITTAAPATNLTADTTNVEGTALTFSRSDHVHAIDVGLPASIQPDFSNAIGTSAELARANHVHRIVTAAPVTNLTADTNNEKGTALTFSRSDHVHAVNTGTPVSIIPDQANAEGSSAELARADHVHNIPADVPMNIGTANAEGSQNAFARADHIHDHGQQTQGDLHEAVTQSKNGFMSAADKIKLDGRKAGIVSSGSFSGTPQKATVNFTTGWPDTNYTIVVLGIDERAWTYENKTTSGFVINSNANQPLTGEVSWIAIRSGE